MTDAYAGNDAETAQGKRILPALILLAGIAVAALLYQLRPVPEHQPIATTAALVDAIEVSSETVQLKVNTHGTMSASTETRLAAEVQGRIVEVSADFVAGGFLRRGDVLLKIDDLEYKTAVTRARAAVASAATRLAEEKGRAEVAYQDWLRRNPAHKRSDSAHDLALRKPQIAEAEANLEAARADLAHAKENLARTVVTAPYDGLLRSRAVALGQHVSIGQELGNIFATDQLEVRLPVPEHRIHALHLPALSSDADSASITAQLSIEMQGQTYYWQARIARTEGVLDERSRVLYLIATVDDPYRLKAQQRDSHPPLRLGTFVDAVIYGRTVDDVVRIPHHVLRTDNQVWVIDADGSMHSRSVEVVSTDSDYVYLAAGLSDGEHVAMGHIDTAVEGARVEIARLLPSTPAGETRVAGDRHHKPRAASSPASATHAEPAVPVVSEDNATAQGI